MSVDTTAGSLATRVVGKATKRVEGMEKVTGTARYTEDLSLPGMLYARLVLSPHAHARVVRIPAALAMQVSGVVAVLTASDLPAGVTHKIMAGEETRYTGQPVAIVLAETEAAAADGADRLGAEVEYANLPAVLTPTEALRAGAPLVATETEENPEAAGHATVSAGAVTETLPRNVANRYHFTRGDVAQGFREADVITERTYTTSRVHQSYLEPHATLAAPDPVTGEVTIYKATRRNPGRAPGSSGLRLRGLARCARLDRCDPAGRVLQGAASRDRVAGGAHAQAPQWGVSGPRRAAGCV